MRRKYPLENENIEQVTYAVDGKTKLPLVYSELTHAKLAYLYGWAVKTACEYYGAHMFLLHKMVTTAPLSPLQLKAFDARAEYLMHEEERYWSVAMGLREEMLKREMINEHEIPVG